tara:strand:+ start:840 stop:1469 length:630 start_codon:yes stop_codon:yes gene_type:complete
MSQVNMLTYAIALIPENAGKIDAINRIILGETLSAQAPIEKAKTAVEKTAKEKPAAKTVVKETNTDSATSMDDLKAAAKAAKAAHGEDFVKQVMEDNDIKPLASLGRSMSKIALDQYDDVIAGWKAGPKAADDLGDDLDDDDLGDDLDDDDLGDEAPTPEAVKLALKAYSQAGNREEAKALMKANGAKALSDVDNCTAAQLTAMFAKLV